jgi:hypothetical protein
MEDAGLSGASLLGLRAAALLVRDHPFSKPSLNGRSAAFRILIKVSESTRLGNKDAEHPVLSLHRHFHIPTYRTQPTERTEESAQLQLLNMIARGP